MLPADLQKLLDGIDACEADAERLVADLDDEAVNWRPPEGGWSIAQCLSHLALMNDFYLRGWPEAVAEAAGAQRGPFRGLRPTVVGRLFVASMEPPVRMRAKAIAAVSPGPRFTRDAVLEDYRTSHDRYRQLVRASAAVDVNRIVRPNAIVRQVKMRLATVLLLIPAHDRRHLWQAHDVKVRWQGRAAPSAAPVA